jgi:hypothetical protein
LLVVAGVFYYFKLIKGSLEVIKMISKNILLINKKHEEFSWNKLGDIKQGRGDLGMEMPVLIYRLMQYTMLDVLSKVHGPDKANDYFRQAGHLAGLEFAKNSQDLNADLNSFIADLKKTLRDLKVGTLHVEAYDPDNGNIVLTVTQDMDYSSLGKTGESIYFYDEGFVTGILEAYTGKRYKVQEANSWANGSRICRFNGNVVA